MKRKILIGISVVTLVLIILLIYTVIISFQLVKQNTDNINIKLKENFQTIVRIPEPIPPAFRSFEKTVYNWEMVTNEEETIMVSFEHNTGISKNQNIITAKLQIPPGADPSLFNKVLPAVLADKQALYSAQDLEHANLGSNTEVGYSKLELFTSEKNTGQVTGIEWQFDREKILSGTEQYFEKLHKYNEFFLKILYSIQRGIIILLAP